MKAPRTELGIAHIKAMAKCTPKMRALLRGVSQRGGQIWGTAKALGISAHSVHRWMRDPRFVAARELQERVDEEQSGVTRASIINRTNEVIERCLQHIEPVLDRNGNHVETETAEGQPAKAYVFNDKGALKGLEMLAKFKGMTTERVEISGRDGAPIEVTDTTRRDAIRRMLFALRSAEEEAKISAPEGSGTSTST